MSRTGQAAPIALLPVPSSAEAPPMVDPAGLPSASLPARDMPAAPLSFLGLWRRKVLPEKSRRKSRSWQVSLLTCCWQLLSRRTSSMPWRSVNTAQLPRDIRFQRHVLSSLERHPGPWLGSISLYSVLASALVLALIRCHHVSNCLRHALVFKRGAYPMQPPPRMAC